MRNSMCWLGVDMWVVCRKGRVSRGGGRERSRRSDLIFGDVWKFAWCLLFACSDLSSLATLRTIVVVCDRNLEESNWGSSNDLNRYFMLA